jgi:ABC-type transporter Mla subunit MlaD
MTDYQTKQRRRNMVVGIFVVFALGVFLWMLFRFRELPLFVSKLQSFNVLVHFPEAPGVQPDTPVQYCGYQIGRVVKVSPPQFYGDSHRVGVTLAIEKRYLDIPEEVDIFVIKRGLGSSFVELRVDPSKITQADKFLSHGMEIDTGLSENTNAVIGDGENQMNIKKMISSIESAFAQADATMQSIQQLSDETAEKVQVAGDKILVAAEQLEGVLSESRQILEAIESGEGTAGKMINDGRLYEDLLESSQELRMLLEQLKEWVGESREKGLKLRHGL